MKTIFSAFVVALCISTHAAADSYKDKTVRMLELSNSIQPTIDAMARMLHSMRPMLTRQLQQGLSKKGAEVTPAEIDTFLQTYSTTFLARFREEMVPLLVDVMRDHYSEQNVDELIALMETPAFRKYAERLPEVTVSAQKAGENLGRRLGTQIMLDLVKENPKFSIN